VEVTEVTHPSVEEVAEHLEDLLPPAEQTRVRTHLQECEACATLARRLGEVSQALRTAGAVAPPAPAEVSARVEEALGREAQRRAGGAEPGTPVAGLDERRRRRRVLSGGLLAAAAATVVAVGLGQLGQTGVSGDSAAPAAGSAVRSGGQREQAGRAAAEQGDALSSARAPRATHGRRAAEGNSGDVSSFGPLRQSLRLGGISLVEGVAAAHTPAAPAHDRRGCVRAALGADAGLLPSYAVQVPGGHGPGAVVLRPEGAPTVGVLVACAPRPRVLLRHELSG
jgi:hypothetical protein